MNIEESSKIPEEENLDVTANTEGAAFDEAEQKLLVFVKTNLDKMKNNLISQQDYPTLDRINKALIEYEQIQFSLNYLYNRVKFDVERAQYEYDSFFAQAYMNVKEEYNRKDNKKEWYSVKEIEYTVQNKFKNKLSQLRAKIAAAESRRSFCERQCRGWEAYQFVLTQLSKNLIADANASKVDYAMLDKHPMAREDMEDR